MEFVGQPGSHSSGPTQARVGPSRAAPGLSRCGSTTFQTTLGCGSLTPLGLVTTLSALFATWKPLHHNWTKLPLTHENAVMPTSICLCCSPLNGMLSSFSSFSPYIKANCNDTSFQTVPSSNLSTSLESLFSRTAGVAPGI